MVGLSVSRFDVRRRACARNVRLAGGLLGAFAVLGALVAAGATSGVDQFSVDHLMPGLYPYVLGHGGFVIWGHSVISNPNRIINRLGDTVTAPASFGPATALAAVLLGLDVLVRRRLQTALVFGAGYLLGNLVEFAGKYVLVRPPLYVGSDVARLPIWKFAASFPSGHTIRALLLVAILGAVCPALRFVGLAWLAAVVVLLEIAGTHTPTDIAGGLLVGSALALFCTEAARSTISTVSPTALRCP
jgi:membrane-associated phospholipid phosphatase